MLLVAVDEAGYGPKLGPLVVAATTWRVEPGVVRDLFATATHAVSTASYLAALNAAFAPLSQPVDVGGVAVRVDDSKRIFQRSDGKAAPLQKLQQVLSVACHLLQSELPIESNQNVTPTDWPGCIRHWIAEDLQAVLETPWLAGMIQTDLWPREIARDVVDKDLCRDACMRWRAMPLHLRSVQARVITADRFNQFCCGGSSGVPRGNKSDLLSETSLQLVADCLQRASVQPDLASATNAASFADDTAAIETPQRSLVFFDRHGGRRYYASVIQHIFPDHAIEVLEETARRSVYRIRSETTEMVCHFTVKGDSFAPVAFASLHAKYLREIAMGCFNQFFHDAWRNSPSATADPPRPTAGYPVDADRYLSEIQPLWDTMSGSCPDLVRCR